MYYTIFLLFFSTVIPLFSFGHSVFRKHFGLCIICLLQHLGFFLTVFETNLSNRIKQLEERRSNVEKSTQTAQAEATENKEDSEKEVLICK